MQDPLYKDYIMKKIDNGDNIELILAMAWYDAYLGDWPKMNGMQRMALVEIAMDEYQEMKRKL